MHKIQQSFLQKISSRPVWRELNLNALKSNIAEIRRRIGRKIKIIASIKANAYGHGVVKIASKLEETGIDMLATGSFEDAVSIRNSGINTRIEMFGGALPEAMPKFLEYNLTPTLYSMELAESFSKLASRPTNVHIKIDFGLGRIGVPSSEGISFIDAVSKLPNLLIEAVYTHLPFASKDGRDWALPRIRSFENFLDLLGKAGHHPPITEVISSSGLQAYVPSTCTAICPGQILYGITNGPDWYADDRGLKPVMSAIRARLINKLSYRQAVQIGSSGMFQMPLGSTVGTIPCGLYDGYRPALPNKKLYGIMRGCRLPVLGVTMEHTTVDLTGIENPQIGEIITLLGKDTNEVITLRELSEHTGISQIAMLMGFSGKFLDYIN